MQTLPARFVYILAGATAFEGVRAGAATFRVLVDLPARNEIGTVAFAHFSRATDLSPRGIAFYVLFGFGGLVVTAAAWLAARRYRAPSGMIRCTAIAATCSALVLVVTAFAAPIMWGIGSAPDDPLRLEDALDRFSRLTLVRAVLVDLSFAMILATLVAVARPPRSAFSR